jgi:hypothetical protein
LPFLLTKNEHFDGSIDHKVDGQAAIIFFIVPAAGAVGVPAGKTGIYVLGDILFDPRHGLVPGKMVMAGKRIGPAVVPTEDDGAMVSELMGQPMNTGRESGCGKARVPSVSIDLIEGGHDNRNGPLHEASGQTSLEGQHV